MKSYKGYLDGRFVCEFQDFEGGFARRTFWAMVLKQNRLINLDPSRIRVERVV